MPNKQKKIELKDGLYWPVEKWRKNAWAHDESIYQIDPLEFWEDRAKELKWSQKWNEVFKHEPPYFQWFLGGKINITENCLDENLKKNSQKIALIWEPEPTDEPAQTFTYQELAIQVNKFANALKSLGVKKGDTIGIYLPMIPEIVIAMLACARIGAVHSVVFSAFSSSALRVRLQDAKAKILITSDGYFRRGKIMNLKEGADEGIKETSVEKVIVAKRAKNPVTWQEGQDLWWSDLVANESDQCESEPMDSEDLAFILYTSGSTGIPKGTVHHCGGYAVQAKATGKYIFDMHPDDIFWCTSDPGWITGHTYTIYAPLLNGITTIMLEGAPDFPTPDRWAQIIEKYGVTIFYTAPTAIRMFEKYGAEVIKPYSFETLRLLGSVGEPIDESAWLWYFNEVGKGNCPIVDTWWQTETGGILMSSLPGIGPFRPSYSGRPFPGIKVDILDDQGKPCKENQEGNLVILPPFAPGLLRGIFNNPTKYVETYWSQYGDKVYFTSDAAYKNEQGLIRIIGRVDDVIKVAGHRLATGEMESAINLHSDINESAVIGVTDEIKGETPLAFVVYKGQKPAEEIKKEIVDKIRKEIGPIATPKEIYLVEDLPKTRSGKIMRRVLKKLYKKEDPGDTSTLSNPEIVEKIKAIFQ